MKDWPASISRDTRGARVSVLCPYLYWPYFVSGNVAILRRKTANLCLKMVGVHMCIRHGVTTFASLVPTLDCTFRTSSLVTLHTWLGLCWHLTLHGIVLCFLSICYHCFSKQSKWSYTDCFISCKSQSRCNEMIPENAQQGANSNHLFADTVACNIYRNKFVAILRVGQKEFFI